MEKFKLEIEKKAIGIRREYNIDSYGIGNISSLIEKMDIYLIRIPLGKNTVCGFSTVFEGKKVIVSNSSEILSREIFTIAHELGHCIYDLDDEGFIVDKDIFSNSDKDIVEFRADYFAATFLLPESKIRDFIKMELEKETKDIRAIDIVRIQTEFNVSFSTAVKRLRELDLITEQHKELLYRERSSKTSKNLFKAMNLNTYLLEPSNVTKVPDKYYEYVFSNFEKGYITFDKYIEALKVVNFDTSGIEDNTEKVDDVEEELDDLVEGY